MNIFKKTILTGATLLGSFFASQAYAQDRFNEDDKPASAEKTEKKSVSLADDGAAVSRKLDDILRGSLQIKAEHEPLADRFSGSAQFEYITGNLRPYFGIQDVFEKWDNIDGSELEVNSIRGIAALGWYALSNREFELFLRPVLGYEHSTFKEEIDMDAHRFIYGAELGVASREHGYKLLGKFYKGSGKFDGELLSGFEIDGNYDTTFAGIEGRVALHREKAKQSGLLEFDRRQDERDAEFIVDLLAEAYWNRNKFGKLETDDTLQFRIGPSFTLNNRDENGRGNIWSLTPYVAYKVLNTESGISLRETRTQTLGAGAILTYSPCRNFSISGTVGYQGNEQRIDDPGQNIDKDKTKGGIAGGIVIKFDF